MVSTKAAKLVSRESANYEFVSIPDGRSFLWRMDDYPWRQSVWNYHPEFEIHLIRHSSGLAFIGDHIGDFKAGHLVLVGSNLPHNWITPSLENTTVSDRDIVVQFDLQRIIQASENLPELTLMKPLFEKARLGIEFLGDTALEGRRILERMGNGSALQQLSDLLELLVLLSKSTENRTLSTLHFVESFRPGNSRDRELIDMALAYIEQNYKNKIKLNDVADLVGMTEAHFRDTLKTKRAIVIQIMSRNCACGQPVNCWKKHQNQSPPFVTSVVTAIYRSSIECFLRILESPRQGIVLLRVRIQNRSDYYYLRFTKISAKFDLTGGLNIYGVQQNNALNLAVSSINEAGGVNGELLSTMTLNPSSQNIHSMLKRQCFALVSAQSLMASSVLSSINSF